MVPSQPAATEACHSLPAPPPRHGCIPGWSEGIPGDPTYPLTAPGYLAASRVLLLHLNRCAVIAIICRCTSRKGNREFVGIILDENRGEAKRRIGRVDGLI